MDGRRHTDRATIPITKDTDIVKARQLGREMAADAGCGTTDLTMVATAISEIARNMLTHAGGGDVDFELVDDRGRHALVITARDHGPGIEDLDRALQDGYTTGDGLGLGLPGARRLMDDFTVTTDAKSGTTVVMRKWCAAD